MPDKTLSDAGHVAFAVGIALLLWAFLRWLDERGGPPHA
jgi:hypothetical protein